VKKKGLEDGNSESARKLLQLLKKLSIQDIFPNVEIILRVYLTMSVTNASGERSFSALKRVKNYLRSSLKQDTLNALSLLYIENDILGSVVFEDTIKKFSEAKARKQDFV